MVYYVAPNGRQVHRKRCARLSRTQKLRRIFTSEGRTFCPICFPDAAAAQAFVVRVVEL